MYFNVCMITLCPWSWKILIKLFDFFHFVKKLCFATEIQLYTVAILISVPVFLRRFDRPKDPLKFVQQPLKI